ncbi:MAG TPA: hypothetical protein VF221_05905 [Chloroflexota bacterium]
MQIVEGIIAVIVLLSLVFFVVYIVGTVRLPTGHRPRTPTLDRYGDPLPASPNPGSHETEDEEEGS